MQITLPRWATQPQERRVVFAVLITVFGLLTYTLPGDEAAGWSMFGTTALMFWLWAMSDQFSGFFPWFTGLGTPLAYNIAWADTQLSMMIAVVTVASMGAYAQARGLARNTVLTYAFVIATLRVVDAIGGDFSWPLWVVALAAAWVIGDFLWRYENTVDELEQTKSLVVDQAMLNERRRIARDVHDLVGHSLSVVLLHVTGARHLVHTDPHEAERALEQAEVASRQSLAEIRRTVSLLRDDADAGAPVVPSAELMDAKQLVDDFLLAGLDVHLHQEGPLHTVDPAVSLAGYRIVQEALTNVSRHTVGAEVHVTIEVDEHDCEIVVTNRGGNPTDLGQGSGLGLVSMRERAKSVGGSLLAGPTPDGWTVEASLPVTSSVRR